MNKNLSNLPNLNSLKIGGAFSLQKYLSEKITLLMNWKIVAAIIVGILLVISAYFIYKKMVNSKTSSFHPNRENIPKDTNSNKTATLMLFYVDWCPHCKTAKPEWDSLKAEYDNKIINGYNLSLIEYNCTNESEEVSQLMDKYSIEGYPTIKLVKDNQIIEYDAKPTKSTMEQFLNTVL
jgi:thiol-disulfide isomerase/thioredoxin